MIANLVLWQEFWKNENSVQIIVTLFFISIVSFYEFIVYRIVSHRTIYNKGFHTSITVIPFFIGAIIYALQANVYITLGTIGALAIIRYRTAIKDPVDMIYILWSVFIGISCGCQLFKLCIITSLTVTVCLLLINVCSDSLLKNPFVLLVNSDRNNENQIIDAIKNKISSCRVKSRNYTEEGIDYIFQINTKNAKEIPDILQNIEGIKRFSLLEYDNEDSI